MKLAKERAVGEASTGKSRRGGTGIELRQACERGIPQSSADAYVQVHAVVR